MLGLLRMASREGYAMTRLPPPRSLRYVTSLQRERSPGCDAGFCPGGQTGGLSMACSMPPM